MLAQIYPRTFLNLSLTSGNPDRELTLNCVYKFSDFVNILYSSDAYQNRNSNGTGKNGSKSSTCNVKWTLSKLDTVPSALGNEIHLQHHQHYVIWDQLWAGTFILNSRVLSDVNKCEKCCRQLHEHCGERSYKCETNGKVYGKCFVENHLQCFLASFSTFGIHFRICYIKLEKSNYISLS